MSHHTPVARLQFAIALLGSQQKLVDAIDGIVSQSAISRMALGQTRITPAVAKAVERASDHQVRRWELLPDVWDAPIEPKPSQPRGRARAREAAHG